MSHFQFHKHMFHFSDTAADLSLRHLRLHCDREHIRHHRDIHVQSPEESNALLYPAFSSCRFGYKLHPSSYNDSMASVSDLLTGMITVVTDLTWKTTVEWHAGLVGCKIIRFLQVSVK
eukprot:GHVO01043022.1.p1 GENE.GHVO01043022.1~~GHVO01043022.1.p1  ORF type:complete len:118 (-),score=2.21 GHVO01043022.1:584-937(-)